MDNNEQIVVGLTLQDQQRLRERMHKLRNILGMISAFGELLSLEPLSEKGKDRSRKIVAGIMEARDIIDEIHGAIVPPPKT